ncbi:MAG: hypothetical protein M1829_000439 [Trizodia sp. TS-e1964]|nr:MAG: hypothetical protein M1829_000439 [Trizodia sp. TS-e1964]
MTDSEVAAEARLLLALNPPTAESTSRLKLLIPQLEKDCADLESRTAVNEQSNARLKAILEDNTKILESMENGLSTMRAENRLKWTHLTQLWAGKAQTALSNQEERVRSMELLDDHLDGIIEQYKSNQAQVKEIRAVIAEETSKMPVHVQAKVSLAEIEYEGTPKGVDKNSRC